MWPGVNEVWAAAGLIGTAALLVGFAGALAHQWTKH